LGGLHPETTITQSCMVS